MTGSSEVGLGNGGGSWTKVAATGDCLELGGVDVAATLTDVGVSTPRFSDG